jgi:hypothetical protein
MSGMFLLAVVSLGVNSQAQAAGAGPCQQIENDCKTNGYIAGEAKLGKGLWWDCMCPLIAPGFPEPSKNVLAVPSDQGLVPACRQHPFGQKILTNCANMLAKKNAKQATH